MSLRPPQVLPTALLSLLAAALCLALTWTIATPPWQSPDENSHFGYLQHLVETGELPGDATRPLFSTEQTEAQLFSNADQAAAQAAQPMESRRSEYERWLVRAKLLTPEDRQDGGGPNPAASNPPLYYLSLAPAYYVLNDASIFTRLWAARALSAVWLLLTVVAAWLLGREVFEDERSATVVAGFAALTPMIGFLSGTINPDGALFALWTAVLWLGVRVLKRGLTYRRASAFGALLGMALLVKATSYALIPAGAYVLVYGAWRANRATVVLPAAATFLLVLVPWFVVARAMERSPAAQVGVVTDQATFNVRELLSYTWQYYLPELPFMTKYPSVAETLPAYDLLIKGTVGAFGWLEVQYPEWVYIVASCVAVLVLAGLLLSLVRRRRLPAEVLFLLLVTVGLLGGLHYSEYNQLEGGASNFIQGRYLLPLIGVAGLALVTAARQLPPRLTEPLLTAALAALVVLNVWGVALTVERFSA